MFKLVCKTCKKLESVLASTAVCSTLSLCFWVFLLDLGTEDPRRFPEPENFEMPPLPLVSLVVPRVLVVLLVDLLAFLDCAANETDFLVFDMVGVILYLFNIFSGCR